MARGTKPAKDIEQHLRITCEFLEKQGPQAASRLRATLNVAYSVRQSMWLPNADLKLLMIPRKIPAVGDLGPDCIWTAHPAWKQNLADIIERDRLYKELRKAGKDKEYEELWNKWKRRLGFR